MFVYFCVLNRFVLQRIARKRFREPAARRRLRAPVAPPRAGTRRGGAQEARFAEKNSGFEGVAGLDRESKER